MNGFVSSCLITITFFSGREQAKAVKAELLLEKFAEKKYGRTFLRILENCTHLNLL